MFKRIFVFWCVLAPYFELSAQDPGFNPDKVEPQTSAFRKFMTNFSFNLQAGYGRTFYTHDIPQLAILRNNGEILITEDDNPGVNNPISAYRYWLNDPQEINTTFNTNDQLISSDSTTLRMTGRGNNIPLTFSIHYTIKEKFRIGGGATFELHSISKVGLKSTDTLGTYQSNYKSTIFKRYFGLVGYRFLAFRNLSYVAEARVGSFNLGNKYNSSLIQKGLFFDVGVSIEKHLSEYFRVTLRPSVEMKNYTMTFPDSEIALKHKMITPYVSIGASYSIPELKRCPIKSCHIQINHVHGGKEYRSRRHPFYKKQNPNYGENYPQLFRYKGKNKRKL
ncbi:hypothetical protein QQ020_32230 [Fulvivirgaceae bacterium BMA12]|uniref:Uncharacterized protein n=1 Tax=Agaribacillus aureus TaxID=3051825 RepID=A0ABT8LKG0_9BACT|nr:hypothetical protein [Fulvivirgaceae bacterium BMA12]